VVRAVKISGERDLQGKAERVHSVRGRRPSRTWALGGIFKEAPEVFITPAQFNNELSQKGEHSRNGQAHRRRALHQLLAHLLARALPTGHRCPSVHPPLPMNFDMASFTHPSSLPSGRDTYRCAVFFSSLPLNPRYGLLLPSTSSDARDPPAPRPASRLQCRRAARVSDEYFGARFSASRIDAITSAFDSSMLTPPNALGDGCAVPPDRWVPTSDKNASSMRTASLEAPASCATAATAAVVRTAEAGVAPPKPIKSIISDCATCARNSSQSYCHVPSSANFWPRVVSN